ncbi:MAG: hypothetical protein JW922_09625 [Paludibacteraceae bacterium]|nr:hypothetical protein [Paludibacteraceae bacterium]
MKNHINYKLFFCVFAFLLLLQIRTANSQGVIPGFKYTKDEILEMQALIVQNNRRIQQLKPWEPQQVPFSVGKTIGGHDYDLIIADMRFDKEGVLIDAFLVIWDPFFNRNIFFGGKDIRMSPFGFSGGGELLLLDDFVAEYDAIGKFTLKAANAGNYVSFDCDGFKGIGIDGEIEFTRDLLLPADVSKLNDRVLATFKGYAESWQDIIVELKIDPFRVKGLNDFTFTVSDAKFDFSDFRNPEGTKFPGSYSESDKSALWRGFYLKTLIVTVPSIFTKNDGTPTTLGADDLMIDEMGVSGHFYGNKLIKFQDGNMSKWQYSLDTLYAEFEKSQFMDAGFAGAIKTSIHDKDDPFGLNYGGRISTESIDLYGALTTDVTFKSSAFSSEIVLRKDTRIETSILNNKFYPKAVLNGSLTVKRKEVNASAKFEELTLQTESPRFSCKKFGANISQNDPVFANFPIKIDTLFLNTYPEDVVGLGFGISLNLTDEIATNGVFEVQAAIDDSKWLKYKYHDLKIHNFLIKADYSAFSLDGGLAFFDDNTTYEQGFKGYMKLGVSSIGLNVSAVGQFGRNDSFRYFFVDALATINPGIACIPGVLDFYGFSGGVFYNMSFDPKATFSVPLETDLLKPGVSQSGRVYFPEKGAFGLKAGTIIGLTGGADGGARIFNANAELGIYLQNGALQSITFDGGAYFMKDLNAPASESKLWAQMNVIYNHEPENRFFDAKLETFVNLDPLIVGAYPNNSAGTATMYFSKDKWNIYFGTPQTPISVKLFKLGSFGGITSGSYFMAGNDPGMPDIPNLTERLSLSGVQVKNQRNNAVLKTMSGFAYGAEIGTSDKNFKVKDQKYLCFYGRFNFMAGYDIMVRQIDPLSCSGNDDFGFNNWYASGQAYAAVDAAVGIEAKLFRKTIKEEIFSLKTSAGIQAELPNPTFMQGMVSSKYRIFGGLISGKCDFKFKLGNKLECQGSGNLLDNITIIADATPYNNAKDISVFNQPQIVFNMPIGVVFKLQDGEGRDHNYKAKLDFFTVKGPSGIINGEYEWNNEKTVIIFTPDEMLPDTTEITLKGQVSFLYKGPGDSDWSVLEDANNETIDRKFKTGTAPQEILPEHIMYSYPVEKQLYFLPEEHNSGYIQLSRNYSRLFAPDAGWKFEGRFTPIGGTPIPFAFTYDASTLRINYTLPSGLANQTIYNLTLVKAPVASSIPDVDSNVEVVLNTRMEESDSKVDVRESTTTGTLDKLQEKIMYNIFFRTSKFSSFNSKIAHYKKAYGTFDGVDRICSRFLGTEAFDKFELGGFDGGNALVTIEAMEDNEWISYINWMIYDNYPIGNYFVKRDVTVWGAPPVKNCYLEVEQGLVEKLTDDMILTNTFYLTNYYFSWVRYDIPYPVYCDYDDLNTKYLNTSITNSVLLEYMHRLGNGKPLVYGGWGRLGHNYNLKVLMYYNLPGSNKPNSSYTIQIWD